MPDRPSARLEENLGGPFPVFGEPRARRALAVGGHGFAGREEVNIRWSAAFRHEDGEWKAVQVHASVGIPDEELLGTNPPG